MFLNEDPKIIENVLPSLAAYQALLLIKGILEVKEFEKKKELEKLEREGVPAKIDIVEEVIVIPEKKAGDSSPMKGRNPLLV